MSLLRKLATMLSLVFCAASAARAGGLSIVVGQHNYPPGTGVVVIHIIVTGTNLVHGSDLTVQLGGTPTSLAPLGTAPPITYEGSEQYNNPTPGAGSPVLSPSMWDAHPSSWEDNTDGHADDIPTTPGSPGYGTGYSQGTWFAGSLVFNSISTSYGTINPNNGVEVNLVVNLTGFGPGTWALRLLHGKAGSTDFVDLNGNFLPTNITDGSITVTPEPASLVLGLFAAAGLGILAIRKHRARRSA